MQDLSITISPSPVLVHRAQALVGAAALHAAPRRVLCLGVCGNTLARAVKDVFPKARVDAVDLDAGELPQRARAAGRRWDVVLHDLFEGDPLMAVSFFHELATVLDPDGLVAIHSSAQGERLRHETVTCSQSFAGVFQIVSERTRVVVGHPTNPPAYATAFANLRRHAGALVRAGIRPELIAARMRPLGTAWPAAPAVSPLNVCHPGESREPPFASRGQGAL